ncbi:MAG: hypothetical protein M3336_03390, partial [Chloroflexota bacterium]|nr:hypothetical protein [Chloroflexota bacterium]
LLALALVGLEWLALGRLSGISWPHAAAPAWPPASWALHVLVGAFLVGLAQLLLAALGIGFGSVAVVLLAAALMGALIRKTQLPHLAPSKRHIPQDRRERAAWLVLAALLLAAGVRSLIVPEAGWDAYSHWGLKARAFALAGQIVDAGTVHEYYPPLVPLLEAWLYLHRGSTSIDLAKTVWSLFGAAFAVCLTWHLRLALATPWLAPLMGTLIVLAVPQLLESFWTGQADLALTAYLTLATLALWQWQWRWRRGVTNSRGWLAQAALFAAAAALTKYEGLPRLAVLAVAVLLARQPTGLVTAVAGGVAYALWLVYRLQHGIQASGEHLSHFQPQAIGATLVTTAAVLGGIRTGGGVLVAVCAWAVNIRRVFEPRVRLLTVVVLGQLLATLLAFLVSETPPELQARTSATRLFQHFMPLALFVAALWLAELRPIIRRER